MLKNTFKVNEKCTEQQRETEADCKCTVCLEDAA